VRSSAASRSTSAGGRTGWRRARCARTGWQPGSRSWGSRPSRSASLSRGSAARGHVASPGPPPSCASSRARSSSRPRSTGRAPCTACPSYSQWSSAPPSPASSPRPSEWVRCACAVCCSRSARWPSPSPPRCTSFPRPILVGLEGTTTGEVDRGKLGPIDLTIHNRAYYFFALGTLVVVLLLVGHLRRTGIGRAIVGVRENESGAAAFTVSPTRTKLTAFALSGFLAGLGGAVLAGTVQTFGFHDAFFRVQDSLSIVAIAVIGGLGSLAGAVMGAVWVVGLPLFWPKNQTVPLLTSSLGLLIVLLYIPGGFTQLGYGLRSMILRWLEQRLPERATKSVTVPPSRCPPAQWRPRRRTMTEAPFAPSRSASNSAASSRSTRSIFHAMPGEVIGLIGTNGGREVDPAERDRRLRAEPWTGRAPRHRRVPAAAAHARPSRPRAHVPGRNPLPRADGARDGAARARGPGRTSFWGSLLFAPTSIAKERTKRAEGRRAHRLPRPRPLRPTGSSPSSPRVRAASSS